MRVIRWHGKRYTDAEIIAMREATIEEVRKYADNMATELERVRAQLLLAESLIPVTAHHRYALLSKYGRV